MPRHIVGQTYKAFYANEMHALEVLEEEDGFYGIRWDDGTEEGAFEADLDGWIEAAKEKEMEEMYQ